MKRLSISLILLILGLIIGGSGPPGGSSVIDDFINDIFATGDSTYSDGGGIAFQEFTTNCHLFAEKPDSTGLDINGYGFQVCVGEGYWMRTVVKLQKRKNLFWWDTLDTEDTGLWFEDGFQGRDVYATCVSGTHRYRTRTEGTLVTVNGTFTDSAASPSYKISC